VKETVKFQSDTNITIISDLMSPTEVAMPDEDNDCEDISIVCVSAIKKLPSLFNVLEQLHYVRH